MPKDREESRSVAQDTLPAVSRLGRAAVSGRDGATTHTDGQVPSERTGGGIGTPAEPKVKKDKARRKKKAPRLNRSSLDLGGISSHRESSVPLQLILERNQHQAMQRAAAGPVDKPSKLPLQTPTLVLPGSVSHRLVSAATAYASSEAGSHSSSKRRPPKSPASLMPQPSPRHYRGGYSPKPQDIHHQGFTGGFYTDPQAYYLMLSSQRSVAPSDIDTMSVRTGTTSGWDQASMYSRTTATSMQYQYQPMVEVGLKPPPSFTHGSLLAHQQAEEALRKKKGSPPHILQRSPADLAGRWQPTVPVMPASFPSQSPMLVPMVNGNALAYYADAGHGQRPAEYGTLFPATSGSCQPTGPKGPIPYPKPVHRIGSLNVEYDSAEKHTQDELSF
ncbi:uncharacterized protein BJ171DRAFT_512572 [Polychytrium aggregatum]|uniref:uncharacterized protein n=1 Tax=Polychytrium aggregatum TaxID=110093 RepID=UPI0022FDB3A3|nr:uncharacterized protein BJ171DRAFT_512572 [Polychytrium aggregatum]KAI9202907.1 hypothetical protein BJ171DRAFT_512572 [Polychytrium aggregatum]